MFQNKIYAMNHAKFQHYKAYSDNFNSEAATRGVLLNKVFLEISQNSQESTCARVCARPQACNFLKKETPAHVFSCEFWEMSRSTFLTEHLSARNINEKY